MVGGGGGVEHQKQKPASKQVSSVGGREEPHRFARGREVDLLGGGGGGENIKYTACCTHNYSEYSMRGRFGEGGLLRGQG